MLDFLKDKRPLKEQLDVDQLKPDAVVITEISKQLSEMEAAWKAYSDKKRELEAELEAIKTPPVLETGGKTFDEVATVVQNFFTKQAAIKPVEQLEAEKAEYAKWYTSFTVDHLQKLHPVLKAALKKAQDNLAAIEEEFETASNTAELDELFPLVTGDLLNLQQRFLKLGATLINVNGQPVNFEGYSNTVQLADKTVNLSLATNYYVPKRQSLADRKAAAVSRQATEDAYAQRLHEFYASSK